MNEQENKIEEKKTQHTVSWTPLIWMVSLIGGSLFIGYVFFIVFVLSGGFN